MAVKKRGLGRGLDALLSGNKGPASVAPQGVDKDDASSESGDLRVLPVDLIQRGKYQPRSDMHPETLSELADSIRAQGVVQPIVVRPIGEGRYEIIAGERRWRASQMAGLDTIPAVVREVPDQAAMAMALIENIQRENLNPMEEARALQRLIHEFELTHQQTAEAVGRSRAAVSNLLRLLELDEEVMGMVERGDLEMGHARAMLALSADQQRIAGRKVASQGLSVRETERLVKKMLSTASAEPVSSRRVDDPNIRKLEQRLSEVLAAAVSIQHSSKGSGKLVIQYSSLDELDGVLSRLGDFES